MDSVKFPGRSNSNGLSGALSGKFNSEEGYFFVYRVPAFAKDVPTARMRGPSKSYVDIFLVPYKYTISIPLKEIRFRKKRVYYFSYMKFTRIELVDG